MKTRLALNIFLFRAFCTAKYVHFLQRAFYLLVPTSNAYTGRFLHAFNFYLQYNYYLIAFFSWTSIRQVVLENKYLLLYSCRLVARKDMITCVVIQEIIFYRSVLVD